MRTIAFLTASLMLMALPALGLGEMCGEQGCCEAPTVSSPMDCCTIGQAPEPVSLDGVTASSAKALADEALLSQSEGKPADSIQAFALPASNASPLSGRERLAILSILLI